MSDAPKKEEFSVDLLRKEFYKIFYGKEEPPEIIEDNRVFPEGELEDKLLSGYWYSINTPNCKGKRSLTINCGSEGVKLYIQQCKKSGLIIEDIIADSISVFINDEWVKLTDERLKVIDKTKNEDGK